LEPTLLHRRALAAVFRQVRPRLLFAPFWEDAHPDHTAATKLVEDARFWSKLSKSDIAGEPFHPARILYYFSVHLRIVERPSVIMDISDQLDVLSIATGREPARRSARGDRNRLRSDEILGSVGGCAARRTFRQP
jgi:LmbE family N-acetylglucosaminyl deacetylase